MDVFEVLADPTRREVVRLLGQQPRRPAELADAVGASRPAMSRHLRVLLDAEMVSDERTQEDARARIFRLHPESLVAVQAYLDQLQADWKVQLAAFKQHVEQRGTR